MKDHGLFRLSRQLLALPMAILLAACGGGGGSDGNAGGTDPPANPSAAASSVAIDKPLAFFSANGQSMQLAAQPLDAQGAVVPGEIGRASCRDRVYSSG